MKINIVIVAGGLNTRFEDLSIYPKLLLPTKEYSSILHQTLSAFEGYGNADFYIIINTKYYEMLKDYVNANFKDKQIQILPTDNSNGSYNTIASVSNKIPELPTLFIWSDLLISKTIKDDLYKIDTDCINIGTYNGEFRYYVDPINSDIIYPQHGCGLLDVYGRGNIAGIYYFPFFSRMMWNPVPYEQDLVDYMMIKLLGFKTFKITNLYEYRDKSTYLQDVIQDKPNQNKTRFFNTHEIVGNQFIKTSIDPWYNPLIENEYEWYKVFKALIGEQRIPTINWMTKQDNKVSISMEYLKDSKTLISALTDPDMNRSKIFESLNNALQSMSSVTKQISLKKHQDNLHYEVVDKVLNRCNNIKHMIVNYDEQKLMSTLNIAYNSIVAEDYTYVFGHGDLNGSNMMVDDDYNITFIDPRGYFGKTKMFIYEPYEYAKLRYMISGYDDFNNKRTTEEPIEHKDMLEQFYTLFPKAAKYKRVIEILLGVIWIALAGYMSDDIIKANIAYENGMSILERELNL